MKKGMIKLSVLYPVGDGKHFDLEYYCNNHMPLVAKTLGDILKHASYDKGLAGGTPNSPASFVAMANLYFDSMEAFGQAFAASGPALMGDLPNFTNIEPVVQISEVM